jgi:hypothetical protein
MQKCNYVTSLKHGASLEEVMQSKLAKKLRSVAVENGKKTFVDLPLEFEGARAYAIWDSIVLGHYHFKARIELNPKRLKRVTNRTCDYVYHGQLVLPRPQDN